MLETSNCGKICGLLDWYLHEYEFARENIYLREEGGEKQIVIDNQLLHSEREQGLLLKLDRLVRTDAGDNPAAKECLSTSKIFDASPELIRYIGDYEWKPGTGEPIGKRLNPDLFFFRRQISHHPEGRDHLEKNLSNLLNRKMVKPKSCGHFCEQ